MSSSSSAEIVRSALAAQQRGDLVAAASGFRQALLGDPGSPQLHNALGNVLLERNEPNDARRHFEAAVAADPAAPALLLNLAKACRLQVDDEAERAALEAALRLDQRHFMARLRLAELLERRGDGAGAAEHWAAVIALAPSDAECPPGLVPLLDHGRAFLAERTAAMHAALVPALVEAERRGSPLGRRRFGACIDASFGKRRIYANECHGLHYPFLPADEFFDRDHFSWFAELEAATDVVRAEARALLDRRAAGIVPYVQQDAGTPRNKWSDLDRSTAWSAFFLWRHGVRDDDACAACPETAALVDRLPLIDIPGRSPTVFFSILEPHARIPPHTGVTNTRAIVHLPLIVPAGCAFRVGGETRPWAEGRAFAFDDTIEHEAWNDSDEMRVILILDAWNPHLEEDEREMLRRFFVASDASGFGTPAMDG